MNKKIIKLANIEFYEEELEKLYFEDNKKYIVKYKTIYELRYNDARLDKNNRGYLGAIEVYKNYNKKDVGYTKRGRHIVATAKRVNELLGRQFFKED